MTTTNELRTELDEGSARTMQHRYQIGNDSEGYHDGAHTKCEAFRVAMRLANVTSEPAWVYDRMAHVGAAQQWTFQPGWDVRHAARAVPLVDLVRAAKETDR